MCVGPVSGLEYKYNYIFESFLMIREGWWDGSKSDRRRQWHVPAYASDFEMTQNSNHLFFLYLLLEILITCLFAEVAHFFELENVEMAQNSKRNWIRGKNDSNFEPLQHFRAKKSEPLRQKDTWYIFRTCVIDVFRWLFEPSHHTPRMKNSLIVTFHFSLFYLFLKVIEIEKPFQTKFFALSCIALFA